MLCRLSAAIILACAAGVPMAGCASRPGADRATDTVPALPPDTGRALRVFAGDGTPIPWSDLVARCAASEAVMIGEIHDHPAGQAFEAALFADLLAAAPTAVAALEFFERDQQAGLDDYLRGVTDEATMRTATRRTPSGYPPGHRAIVEASRAARRPVLAANAPRRYVRLARTDSYDRLFDLSPEQRRLFRLPARLPEGRYRDAFFKAMGAAQPTPAPSGQADAPSDPAPSPDTLARTEALFRAQSLWDWTMADSVAAAIARDDQPAPDPRDAPRGKPVVLVVGGFHVDHAGEGGLLQALQHLRPGTRAFTILFADTDDPSLRKADRGRADAIVHVGPPTSPSTPTP